jgi:hypothetical protein
VYMPFSSSTGAKLVEVFSDRGEGYLRSEECD